MNEDRKPIPYSEDIRHMTADPSIVGPLVDVFKELEVIGAKDDKKRTTREALTS